MPETVWNPPHISDENSLAATGQANGPEALLFNPAGLAPAYPNGRTSGRKLNRSLFLTRWLFHPAPWFLSGNFCRRARAADGSS